MSLIHWWPLNGNLNDYGTQNLTLEQNGGILFTNGKIGKGASFTTDGQWLKSTDLSTLVAMTNYSMCCWVYLTNTATNHSSSFLSSGNWNTAAKQVCFGLYSYSSGYGRMLVPNGTGWTGGIALSNRITLNSWHHFTIVYDGTMTRGYVDGVSVGTYAGGGISATEVSYYFLGAATYYSGFTMKGVLNDFRIYDHALSPKEVKEISKGLCLHYTFEDPYIEGTTNLVPNSSTFANWSSYDHGYTSIVDCELGEKKIVITDKLSWCGASVPITLPATGTYTLSVYCKPISRSSTSVTATIYTSGGGLNDKSKSVNWENLGCWQKIEMTNTYTTTSIRLYLIAYGGSSTTDTISCEYTMPQVEAKDHVTPYTVSTRPYGYVYDSSGYGYSGTISGDVCMTTDSMCGQYSANIVNSYVSTPTIRFPELSIMFWIKLNETVSGVQYIYTGWPGISIELSANGKLRGYCTYETQQQYDYTVQGGVITIRNVPYTVDDGVITVTSSEPYDRCTVECNDALSVGTWYQCAFVFNGSGGQGYINGVQEGSTQHSGTIYYDSEDFRIGSYTNHVNFNCKIADFKIYSTSLSATDILNDYKRKASVDKYGNLFVGNISETQTITNPKIKKNYLVSASSLSEGLMTKVLDDGSVFERIYYFDYDIAQSVWTKSTAQSCNTPGKFSILGSLNDYVPIDGWYEFYYREWQANTGNSDWVRWKQSFNPLSRFTSGVSGTSSEYTYIGGSRTPYSTFAGLTRYTSDDSTTCYLRGTPSWWACIAPHGTSYDVFPDMWGNSTNNHQQELWIRVDNLKDAHSFEGSNLKMNSTSITSNHINEI